MMLISTGYPQGQVARFGIPVACGGMLYMVKKLERS